MVGRPGRRIVALKQDAYTEARTPNKTEHVIHKRGGWIGLAQLPRAQQVDASVALRQDEREPTRVFTTDEHGVRINEDDG